MTQQDKYEYKLVIGGLDSETANQLILSGWQLSEERNGIPYMKVVLARNANTLTINPGDTVEFYRREVGDGTWGDSWFYGFCKVVDPSSSKAKVTVLAHGILARLEARRLKGKTFGGTHTVDKVFDVTHESSGGVLQRVYVDVTGVTNLQSPLESVRILKMVEYNNFGTSQSYGNVQRFPGAGPRKDWAFPFIGRNGPLRKMWVYGYRSAAGTIDLEVALQEDGGGIPSGVDMDVATVPYTDFGSGIGNVGWVEINLKNKFTDPKNLNIRVGSQYWLEFRLPSTDAQQKYELRFVGSGEALLRHPQRNDDLGGYLEIAVKRTLLFGIDFEGDWVEADPQKYHLDGMANPNRLWFQKWTDAVGDSGSFSNVWGEAPPTLFSGQKTCRLSYWSGTMDYDTTLTAWAKVCASDIYDTLDIDVTEPDQAGYCIHVEDSDCLSVFQELRKYGAIILRVYKNAAGNVVLSVKDEKPATSGEWGNYSGAEQAVRTFRAGYDTVSATQNLISADRRVRELVSEAQNTILIDNNGEIGGIFFQSNLVASSSNIYVGGFGGDLDAGIDYAQRSYDELKTVRVSGSVQVVGIDEGDTTGPYREPNELVYIEDSRIGFDGIFAVQRVKWKGGKGKPTMCELSLTDTLYTTYSKRGTGTSGGQSVPTAMMYGREGGIIPLLKDFVHPANKTYAPTREGFGAGCSDAPNSRRTPAGSMPKAQEIVIHQDNGVEYDATKFYSIRVGAYGTPISPSFASVLATAKTLTIDGDPKVMLMAYIKGGDFDLDYDWTVAFNRLCDGIEVHHADAVGGVETSDGIYRVHEVDGTGDIWGPVPEMGPEKSIAVAIIIDNAI